MSDRKKPYIPPKVTRYQSVDDMPTKFRESAKELLATGAALILSVDQEHRYTGMSEEFARMLGYTSRELIGKRVEDITAQGTVDIDFIFTASRRIGEMQGLWLFEGRDGNKVLCSYRAKKLPSGFTAEVRPLPYGVAA
jgi:PAS domain S-box-containing protein